MPLDRLREPPPCGRAARAFVLAAVAAGLLGAAVVLETPRQVDGGGLAYAVTVAVGAGETVAGIQFDVNVPGAADSVVVEAGPAAVGAGKDVVFSMLDEDTVRVLVVGLNQDQLQSGVLANVYLSPAQQAAAPPALELLGFVTSDPAGNSITPSGGAESPDGAGSGDDDGPADPADTYDASGGSGPSNSSVPVTPAAESASKGGTSPVSGGFMPALLNAFTGENGPYGAGDGTPGDIGGGDAGSTRNGNNSTGAGNGSTGGPADAGPAYAAPGALPPQAYANTSTTRRTAPLRGGASSGSSASRAGAVETAPTNAEPGSAAAAAARAGDPVPAGWTRQAAALPARAGEPVAAPVELDIKPYLNRRSLATAAAGAVAIAIVLRKALLPLARLLRDLVGS